MAHMRKQEKVWLTVLVNAVLGVVAWALIVYFLPYLRPKWPVIAAITVAAVLTIPVYHLWGPSAKED